MTLVYIPLKDLVIQKSIAPFLRQSRRSLEALTASIIDVGLLNPLVVSKQKSKYLVVNGRKRLMVLRQLAKSHVYMKSMHKIPCLSVESANQDTPQTGRPLLLRSSELAHAILADASSGISPISIAHKYECELSVVDEAMSFQNLHPTVLKHFSSETINWEQAAALATIPNPNAQLNLLLQLGPFVSDKDIITAIRSGETVIELPDGNTICLPSRSRKRISVFDRRYFAETAKERLAA